MNLLWSLTTSVLISFDKKNKLDLYKKKESFNLLETNLGLNLHKNIKNELSKLVNNTQSCKKRRKKQLIEITISFLCQNQKHERKKGEKTWENFLRSIFLFAVVHIPCLFVIKPGFLRGKLLQHLAAVIENSFICFFISRRKNERSKKLMK